MCFMQPANHVQAWCWVWFCLQVALCDCATTSGNPAWNNSSSGRHLQQKDKSLTCHMEHFPNLMTLFELSIRQTAWRNVRREEDGPFKSNILKDHYINKNNFFFCSEVFMVAVLQAFHNRLWLSIDDTLSLGVEESSFQMKSAKSNVATERTTLTSIPLPYIIASGSDKSTSAAVTLSCTCQLLLLWFFGSQPKVRPNFPEFTAPPTNPTCSIQYLKYQPVHQGMHRLSFPIHGLLFGMAATQKDMQASWKSPSIHPFSIRASYYTRGGAILAVTGWGQGDTLNQSAVHPRATHVGNLLFAQRKTWTCCEALRRGAYMICSCLCNANVKFKHITHEVSRKMLEVIESEHSTLWKTNEAMKPRRTL